MHAYHFGGDDDPGETLHRDGPFPPGSIAVLAGGKDNDYRSMLLLRGVKNYLDQNKGNITIDGYHNSPGLWVDRFGSYYVKPSEVRTAVEDGTQPPPDKDY